MAVYEYKGLTDEGRNVNGIVDAESPRTARAKLRRSGIFPVEVLQSPQGTPRPEQKNGTIASGVSWTDWLGERVSLQEISVITRQMGTLLSAGLPLLEALSAVEDQTEKRVLKRTLIQVREQVREGSSLAEALAGHPRLFSEVYVQMIRVGEASGTLDRIFVHLAQFLDRQAQLRSRVWSAMAYPILMLVVSAGVLAFLMGFVVPRVLFVFSDMQQALPLATRLLIGTIDFLRGYGWIALILLVGGGILFRQYISTLDGRERFDRWKLRIPFVGRLHKLVAMSRFADTLGILLQGGVSLLQSFDIVKKVVNNRVLEKALESARTQVQEGEGIAEPLRRSGVFPPLVTRMIAVGEASARLEEMLQKIAQSYQNEVDIKLGTFMSLLNPIMVLIMGSVVLFIVAAVLLPILQMSQFVR